MCICSMGTTGIPHVRCELGLSQKGRNGWGKGRGRRGGSFLPDFQIALILVYSYNVGANSLAIEVGGLFCHLIQSCRKCQKMGSSCLASECWGGGLFCPTFRYHQFDHVFRWWMKCVQLCVKICLEKFTLHDLVGGGGSGPIYINF